MKQATIILFVTTALIVAADANAHLMATYTCKSITCIEHRQLQNLKHARYVCGHGAHYNKRWNCAAVKWLTREYNETEAVLHPPRVYSSSSSHYTGWMCIHAREGSWNAQTGNGYYGGLQMTYGWAGRVGNAALMSPDAQIAAADAEAREHGYSYGWMSSQWPNTFPPCSGYF